MAKPAKKRLGPKSRDPRRKAKTSQSSQMKTGWQILFAIDVTALFNELNNKLQDKRLFVHEMHSLVKAFMSKLQLNWTATLSLTCKP